MNNINNQQDTFRTELITASNAKYNHQYPKTSALSREKLAQIYQICKSYQQSYPVLSSELVLPNGKTFGEARAKLYLPENREMLAEIERFQSKSDDFTPYKYLKGMGPTNINGVTHYISSLTAIVERKIKAPMLVDRLDHERFPYCIVVPRRTPLKDLENGDPTMAYLHCLLLPLERVYNGIVLRGPVDLDRLEFYQQELIRHFADPVFREKLREAVQEKIEKKLSEADLTSEAKEKIRVKMEVYDELSAHPTRSRPFFGLIPDEYHNLAHLNIHALDGPVTSDRWDDITIPLEQCIEDIRRQIILDEIVEPLELKIGGDS